MVPHAFGDHTLCNSTWYRYEKNPATYTHKDLPHGKDLFGEELKKVLDRKMISTKVGKSKKEVKNRRNQLRCQKNTKLEKLEKKEGKTYESNIGLNMQVNLQETSLADNRIHNKRSA